MLRVVQEEVVVGAEEEAEALRKHRKKKTSCLITCDVFSSSTVFLLSSACAGVQTSDTGG